MITIGCSDDNGTSESERTGSAGLSRLELWHGASQIVCDHQRGSHPRAAAQAIRVDGEATLTRMVLSEQAQERDASTSVGGEPVFCSAVGLGVELVGSGRAPAGPSDGRQHPV